MAEDEVALAGVASAVVVELRPYDEVIETVAVHIARGAVW